MINLRNNQSGMSLVEVMTAIGVLSVIIFALTTTLDLAQKTMKGSTELLELAALQSELANNLQNSFSLGAGYTSTDATARSMANVINPDSTLPQDVVILDASTGTRVEYQAFSGNPAVAPPEAIWKRFIIRSIRLRKKDVVSGAGDIGRPDDIDPHPVTGGPISRRALMMDLEIGLQPMAAIQDNSQAAGGLIRVIPISVLVERPGAGSWMVAKVGSAEGLSFNVGWRETVPTDPVQDCVASAGSNGALNLCPAGMYVASQQLIYQNDVTYYPVSCGKGCTYWVPVYIRNATPNIRCCKVRL